MKSSRAPSKAGSGAARKGAGPARPAAKAARALRAPAESDAFSLLEQADRGTFPRALYVEGADEALKAAFFAELRAAWARAVPENPRPRVMRADETDVSEILAAVQGGSLFSSRECVLLLEVEDLGRSEKRIAALAGGLTAVGEGTCLVLHESAAESERKTLAPLRAACEALWDAVPPTPDQLRRWGERRLARAGVRAEKGVLESLAETCEGDASACLNELDKLATFAGPDGVVTAADVKALHRPALDTDLPHYLQAIAAGDPTRASQRLFRMLAAGVNEGEILWALVNTVSGALGGWSRFKEASATLARRRTPRDLSRALDALYRAESAWKGGRADEVALLEHVTRVVATAAAPAPAAAQPR